VSKQQSDTFLMSLEIASNMATLPAFMTTTNWTNCKNAWCVHAG